MAFLTSQLSKPGGRQVNEDYGGFIQLDKAACWVIADGLGGHKGGAIASQSAVKAIIDRFTNHPVFSIESLDGLIKAAQASLIKKQEEDYLLSSMRTTLVILISDYKQALWGHIGDSRLYFFRNNQIFSQTKDHSVPQSLVDAKEITAEQIRYHEDRNRLLRALGQNGSLRPAITPAPVLLSPGDAFLLCTDGFWEYVLENEMLFDLSHALSPQQWLDKLELRLLKRVAKQHDNYSATAIFIRQGSDFHKNS